MQISIQPELSLTLSILNMVDTPRPDSSTPSYTVRWKTRTYGQRTMRRTMDCRHADQTFPFMSAFSSSTYYGECIGEYTFWQGVSFKDFPVVRQTNERAHTTSPLQFNISNQLLFYSMEFIYWSTGSFFPLIILITQNSILQCILSSNFAWFLGAS